MGVLLINARFGMWRSKSGWMGTGLQMQTGRMWTLLWPEKPPPAHSGPSPKAWHLELVLSGSGEGGQGC